MFLLILVDNPKLCLVLIPQRSRWSMAQQGLRQLALPLSQCSCSLSAFHQIIIQGSLSCAAKAVKFVQNGLGCEWLPSLPKSTASTRRCLALLLDPNSGLLLPAPLAHQLGQLDHQVAHQVAHLSPFGWLRRACKPMRPCLWWEARVWLKSAKNETFHTAQSIGNSCFRGISWSVDAFLGTFWLLKPKTAVRWRWIGSLESSAGQEALQGWWDMDNPAAIETRHWPDPKRVALQICVCLQRHWRQEGLFCAMGEWWWSCVQEAIRWPWPADILIRPSDHRLRWKAACDPTSDPGVSERDGRFCFGSRTRAVSWNFPGAKEPHKICLMGTHIHTQTHIHKRA